MQTQNGYSVHHNNCAVAEDTAGKPWSLLDLDVSLWC